MSHLDIEAATRDLKRYSDASPREQVEQDSQWVAVLEVVERVRRNVGRRLMPPIDEATARALEAHVSAILEILDRDLGSLITVAQTSGAGDETIIDLGEAALARLAAQAEFSRYYFDESVHRARLTRPIDDFEGELAAMEKRWADCKREVIKFLSRVSELVRAAAPQ